MSTPEAVSERLARYGQVRETIRTALREDENPAGLLRGKTVSERVSELDERRWRAFSDLLSAKHDIIRRMDAIERDFDRARPYFAGGEGYFNEHGLLQSTGQQLEALCARFPLLVDAAVQAEYDYQEAVES